MPHSYLYSFAVAGICKQRMQVFFPKLGKWDRSDQIGKQ